MSLLERDLSPAHESKVALRDLQDRLSDLTPWDASWPLQAAAIGDELDALLRTTQGLAAAAERVLDHALSEGSSLLRGTTPETDAVCGVAVLMSEGELSLASGPTTTPVLLVHGMLATGISLQRAARMWTNGGSNSVLALLCASRSFVGPVAVCEW